MANVAKRPNGRWRARYRDPLGKEHARHFRRKTDAEKWLNDVTADLVRGDYIDPDKSKITITKLSGPWLNNPEWSATTKARNKSILKNYVLPHWGEYMLSQITHDDAQEWVNLLPTKLAPRTRRKIFNVLTGIVEAAVTSGRLNRNPIAKVKLPKAEPVRRRYLTALEVEALAEASDEYGDIVLTLAYCGLRFGELAALQVRNVNVDRRRLQIEKSVTEVDGQLVWSAPKTNKHRSVPFPEFLADEIQERCEGKKLDDPVFTTSRGNVLRIRNARRDWFDLATQATNLNGLTPHELRHTAASLAVAQGASVLAVQRMLGHDKPSTTLDVYSDLFDEDLDDLADRLTGLRTKARADYLRTVDEPNSTGLHVIAL